MDRPRILIAGVGNIFLGDDAFGVEVVQRWRGDRSPTECAWSISASEGWT